MSKLTLPWKQGPAHEVLPNRGCAERADFSGPSLMIKDPYYITCATVLHVMVCQAFMITDLKVIRMHEQEIVIFTAIKRDFILAY